jgi:hypothetical protein
VKRKLATGVTWCLKCDGEMTSDEMAGFFPYDSNGVVSKTSIGAWIWGVCQCGGNADMERVREEYR